MFEAYIYSPINNLTYSVYVKEDLLVVNWLVAYRDTRKNM